MSPIGMGCMGFSHGYGQIPPVDYSIEAIREAYEYGCTHFDTAEVYGRELYHQGHNEEILGKAIAPFRDKVTIATKYFITDDDVASGKPLYACVRRHLEGSMQRLLTDHIDLYYLHKINEAVPLEEVAEVMGRLIREGFISEWGLSQVSGEQLSRAHAVTPVGAVQNIYSMMERDCETDIFPIALDRGIAVVPFSPIASGFLSGKVTTETKFEGDDVRKFVPQLSRENIERNQPVIDLLSRFATEKNATNAQISLAWMLHKYPNVIPIPGSKNKGRIIENLGAWNVRLTDEEFKALDAALDSIKIYGHRGHVENTKTSFGNNWKNEYKS